MEEKMVHLTSKNGFKDIRDGHIYKEVVCCEEHKKYFEEVKPSANNN